MDAVIRFRRFLPDGTWRWAEHTLVVEDEPEPSEDQSDEEDEEQ